MIRSVLILIASSFLIVSTLHAQRLRYIEVTAGFAMYSADLPENPNIRADFYASGFNNNTSTGLSTPYDNVYFDVKGEFFLREKWSLSGGIRYTQATASIENRASGFGDADFFFYRFREQGTTTEYLTIRRIEELVHYAGVPLELRYYPFEVRKFNLFFGVGGDVSFRVASSRDVEFQDNDMRVHEREVLSDFSKASAVNAQLYAAAGIHFGKPGMAKYGFEVTAPTFCIDPSAAGLVRPSVGGGFRVLAAFPLNKNRDE